MTGNTARWLAILGIGALGALVGPTAGEEAAGPLDGLAWMRGEWVRQQGGDRLEEVWSAPSGDSLLGMFRWEKGGKAWMYELMVVTVEEGKPVFRLKHFDRHLAGWEERGPPHAYPLARQTDREVVFESPERDDPRRFVYRQDPEGRLVVRLESVRGEQTASTEFRFEKRR